MSALKQKRIAVLGGGMGSLSAVWYMTNRPDWQDYYDIDVYQMGWRLGGKGASSRDQSGADRILEHGIHMMFGFYDNALELLQELYEELDRPADAPMATFEQAFVGHSMITLVDDFAKDPADPWWNFPMPQMASSTDKTKADPVPKLMLRLAEGLGKLTLRTVEDAGDKALHTLVKELTDGHFDAIDPAHWESHNGSMPRLSLAELKAGAKALGSGGSLKELLAHLGTQLDSLAKAPKEAEQPVGLRGLLVDIVEHLQKWVNLALIALWDSQGARRLLSLASLALAVIRGMLVDFANLWLPDWFSLDHVDFETWLISHGCNRKVAHSCLTMVLRQVGFAKDTGAGAGTTLHWAMRMVIDYHDFFMYKMSSGMGEIIFAPLYEVLKKRGVKFHFFHRVDALRIDKGTVTSIEMGRQLTDVPDYDPLVQIKQAAGGTLPCWPDRPNFEQLGEDGAQLATCWREHPISADLENWWGCWEDTGGSLTLTKGAEEDGFDFVLLGIAVGALKEICSDLCADANNKPFGEMVDTIVTTQTKAFQFWLTETTQDLGYTSGAELDLPNGFSPVVGNYNASFDTWADMSQVLPTENWPPSSGPKSVAYWCSNMGDVGTMPGFGPSNFLETQLRECLVDTVFWMGYKVLPVWPKGVTEPTEATASADEEAWTTLSLAALDPSATSLQPLRPQAPMEISLLAAPVGPLLGTPDGPECPVDCAGNEEDESTSPFVGGGPKAAAEAAISQYFRVPFNPSERYVLSVPGTVFKRLAAWESGYDNMVMAGDWTLNPISAGCIEGTVQSGAMAAQALVGEPTTIYDYWLFTRPPAPAIWLPPAKHGQEPNYINPMVNPIPAPPYEAHGAGLDVFLVEADMTALDDLCDRMLNMGQPDLVFRPIGPFVLFVAASIASFVTSQPRQSAQEQDFGFWIPVFQGKVDEDGNFHAESFAFFLPALWVDPPLACTAGREIYGFQKAVGRLTSPKVPGDPPVWGVEGYVAPQNGDPGVPSPLKAFRWAPVVTVTGRESYSPFFELQTIGEFLEQGLAEVEAILTGKVSFDTSLVLQLLKELGGFQFPIVYLKQFQSVSSSQKACYQAVTWNQNSVTSDLKVALHKGPFTLRTWCYKTCNLASSLGIKVDELNQAVVLIAGRVEFDFTVEPGVELYKVGQTGKPKAVPYGAGVGSLVAGASKGIEKSSPLERLEEVRDDVVKAVKHVRSDVHQEEESLRTKAKGALKGLAHLAKDLLD